MYVFILFYQYTGLNTKINFDTVYTSSPSFENYEKFKLNFEKKNKSIKISCDGGATTGKSTGANWLQKNMIKIFISGLLYRYASYLILKYNPKNKIFFLKRNLKHQL